jgi:diguanylate cyclase (GGDEF)-like protein
MARYGGEEFVVIVPHTPLSNATSLAQRIRKSVEEHDFPVCIEPDKESIIQLTVSIGVAIFGDVTDTRDKLIKVADKNLYRAKNQGRNQVISGLQGPADKESKFKAKSAA